jgi:hypothetical protein
MNSRKLLKTSELVSKIKILKNFSTFLTEIDQERSVMTSS